MPHTTRESQGKKPTDWRLWAILAIAIASLAYNIVSSYAIRGNELKHITTDISTIHKKLDVGFARLERRIERLEDREMSDK